MSKKTEAGHQDEASAQGHKPKLRFPEFRDAPGWDEKRLVEVCDINPSSENMPDSFIYIDLESVVSGSLLFKKKIRKEVAPSRAQRLLKNGDVIYQMVRPYQRNNYLCNFTDGYDYVASTGYAQLRAFSSSGFLFQIIHTDDFVNKVLSKCTGSNYPAINSAGLADIRITIPKPPEQQKIADCLSSVDELIDAQTQRLGTFKAHKKGLMQQLFPAEGETVPKLRFPEFCDAPEWEEKQLGKHIEEFRQSSTVQDEFEVLTSARSGLVRQRDYFDNDRITERDNIGFNIIPPNYITYRSRSDDRRFYFNENNLGITGIISTYYPVFRVLDGSNKFFVELLSRYSVVVGKHSVGTSQTVLSLNELRRIKLLIPSEKEQQEIAGCLSSLDDLIDTQAQKLDALKAHKKGLMQQIFPSLDEVNG